MSKNSYLLTFAIILLFGCQAKKIQNSLEQGFLNPADEYKPKTWMHTVGGNMSKEGLTKDLEAIQKVGIGGVLLFNVDQDVPHGKIAYGSPEYLEMMKHAATECERLGLTFGFHNCDGWSSSGGPWIKPEQSMKMVVYTETQVAGGEKVQIKLAQPFTRRGFYKDIAVLAYPSLPSEVVDFNAKPIITSSDKNFQTELITDGNEDNEAPITGDKPWVQFDYGKPFTAQSFFMVVKDRWAEAELETSNDGVNFTKQRDLFKHKTVHQRLDFFDHFEPITARYFRIKFDKTSVVKEIKLMNTYTIGNMVARIGINRIDDDELSPIGIPTNAQVIDPKSIIDVTNQMDENGNLTTRLPAGNYTIMRFGFTSNGLQNSPASLEGKGLECDKFSKTAIKAHFDAFITKAIDHMQGIKSLQYIEIDSYEMAMQNWTDDLDSIFQSKKGYNLKTFLPLFAGRFVESAKASDAVLEDFRAVTCDLTTQNYYGYFTELCHEKGLKTYFEPYGDGLINELDVAKMADINMGEFWPQRKVRMIGAAVSGSRIYGKNVVAAESFTSVPTTNWKGHPAMVKLKGDSAWVDGINHFMLHRYAHQSNTNVKPGMTMGFWGFHFDRTNTWWYNGGTAWFKYMARGAYMLQQGKPVSDMLIFIGEGSPNALFYRDSFEPNIPMETNFDNVNADVLINRLQIKGNKLVLPDGLEYKVLVLKHCEKLSLKSLEKIHQIAMAGVPIAGFSSVEPGGYNVSDAEKATFKKLVAEIKKQSNVHADYQWDAIFKKYNIVKDLDFEGRNDMSYTHRKLADKDIYFFYNRDQVARQIVGTFNVSGRIPELWNPINGEVTKLAQFKEADGKTKVWMNLQAEESVFVVFQKPSKNITAVNVEGLANINANYILDANNKTKLITSTNGTYKAMLSNGAESVINVNNIPEAKKLDGPWQVEFLKENNYEATQTFKTLTDWKDNANENIKYYSGTAVYRKSFAFDKSKSDVTKAFILDLGNVSVIAEVKLNGKDLGTFWMPPFRVNITDALVSGDNNLEVRITNQWTNRLIGDEQLEATDGYNQKGEKMPDWFINNQPMPASKRSTFTTYNFYNKASKLISAGLLGPVTISCGKEKNLTN
jgi:hypothetical protein